MTFGWWLGNLNKLNSDHRIIAILLTLSAVGLLLEMIPTFLAIASAVTGWSPVIMITFIPAKRHLKRKTFEL